MATTIKQIKDSNGVLHELDSKYWGGKETLKTINGEELFGEGNIDISISGSNSIIEVTYDDLCELRNNNSLVTGQQYRITDYVTTTSQEDTKSAGHQFDIIVTATSNNTLSEIANACACNSDEIYITKFWSSTGWDESPRSFVYDGKYILDGNVYCKYKTENHSGELLFDFNDKTKVYSDGEEIRFVPTYYRNEEFGYTDWTSNDIMIVGGGEFSVPFISTIDYWNNEYPEIIESIKKQYDINYFRYADANLEAWQIWYCIDNDTDRFAWADSTNGKGVIYEMIDEFNNTLPYDFKNIQFKRYHTTGYIEGFVGYDGVGDWSGFGNGGESEYLYTFSMKSNDNTIKDTSLNIYGNNTNKLNVCDNHYLSYIKDGKQYLNNIVHICDEDLDEGFICEGITNTKTGLNCYNISLKDNCNYWALQNNCHDIIMDMGCSGWSCGDDCYHLSIRLNCSHWKLGHGCYNVKSGIACSEWTCGDGCSEWTCGDRNSNWKCGNDCYGWTTGDECSYWVCGNKCYDWKVGIYCSHWECENNCYSWEVGDYNLFWHCDSNSYLWKVEDNRRNFNVCIGVHGTTDKLLLDFPIHSTPSKQQQINASFNEYDMLTIWNPASPINYPIIKRTDTGPSASECIYLAPNVYNIWINNKLPKYVTLSMPKADMVGEYVLRFTIPSTVTNHSLVFSNEIKWVNNDIPTWEAGCTYEISIVDGYATFLKYSL